MRIAKSVRILEAYTPGEQPKAKNVVKLNTNENPYLPSPKCAEVLKDFDLDALRRYPDPVFTALRTRIAKIWKTVPECVFVGNGSDEILTLAAKAFVEDDEAIGSLDPSYSLYRTLAAIRNVPFVPSPLADDFTWRKPVLEADGKKVSLFLLTNPNAPTGTVTPQDTISSFAAKFKGVVIVDEAYADFAKANCVSLATDAKNRNLIVMRTFSKSFSLAGLRVGYCIGPEDLIDALYKVKDSYNADAVAQSVALAALNDLPWMRNNAAKVKKTRARVAKELTRRGWDVLPSESNFLFARPAHRRASELFDDLRKMNIFVRYFKGARTGDRLRITVGTDAEMDALLNALSSLDA
ncbi:MAG: histidinol-phosphate transaminase [Kiritimatiellae bacterium]|nr:histidinol-phosphate transaminase [Kiritimatiellia bacterium]